MDTKQFVVINRVGKYLCASEVSGHGGSRKYAIGWAENLNDAGVFTPLTWSELKKHSEEVNNDWVACLPVKEVRTVELIKDD